MMVEDREAGVGDVKRPGGVTPDKLVRFELADDAAGESRPPDMGRGTARDH
jgi:hypothetical protein